MSILLRIHLALVLLLFCHAFAMAKPLSLEILTKDLVKQIKAQPALASSSYFADLEVRVLTRKALIKDMLKAGKTSEVRKHMLKDRLRRRLPLSLQKHIETSSNYNGTLNAGYADNFINPDESEEIYALQTSDDEIIEIYSQENLTKVSGFRLKAKGIRVDNILGLESLSKIKKRKALAAPANPKILVIMAKDTGDPDSTLSGQTINTVDTAIFQNTGSSVSDFFVENGANPLQGNVLDTDIDVNGWHAFSNLCTSDFNMVQIVNGLAFDYPELDFSQYGRIMMIVPRPNVGTPDCMSWGVAGYAYFSPFNFEAPSGTYQATFAVVRSDYVDVRVVAHEIGHNYTIGHAHSHNCSSGTCVHSEYGDFSLMGFSDSHFNAINKEKLGLIDANNIQVVDPNFDRYNYKLEKLENISSNLQAIKIPTANPGEYYYVEYRKKFGFQYPTESAEGFLSVRRNNPVTITTVLVEDPALDGYVFQKSIKPGANYRDDANDFEISFLETDGDSAIVNLRRNLANPIVNLAPLAGFNLAQGAINANSTEASIDVELNQSLTLTSTSADDDGLITSYEWDLDGDGVYEIFGSDFASINRTFSAEESIVISHRVLDSDGDYSSPATLTVNVIKFNAKPVSAFSLVTANPVVNSQVGFDASLSVDSDGSIVSYAWDYGDSTAETLTINSASHSYANPGYYQVTLTVIDDGGASNSSSQEILVKDPSIQEPLALLSVDKTNALTTEQINFDASSSYDHDGSIASYEWDFGDGTLASGIQQSHSYALAGDYTATLTVLDDLAFSSRASQLISIQKANEAPVAELTLSSENAQVGELVNFDASQSFDNDGTVVSYNWNLGNGVQTNTSLPTLTASYPQAGLYTVSLSVVDNQSLISSGTAQAQITILNIPSPPSLPPSPPPEEELQDKTPLASFSIANEDILIDTEISFDASTSSDDVSILRYLWDLGDGIIRESAGADLKHRYQEPGIYTVTLTVFDGAGQSDSITKDILVESIGELPLADFEIKDTRKNGNPIEFLAGKAIEFNAAKSIDLDGALVSYHWDYGDGVVEISSKPIVRHVYAKAGFYQVSLLVIDNFGNRSKRSLVQEIFVDENKDLSEKLDEGEIQETDDELISNKKRWH